MKALLIATDCAHNEYRITNNAYGGVAYYRLIGPMTEINKLGHEWVYLGNDLYRGDNADFNKFFSNFDIVITKHIDNPKGAKDVQLACEKNNIPLVYDLDDDLFAIREDQPAWSKGYKQGEMKRVYCATNMSFADAFFVSTEPLKESYTKAYKDMFGIDMPMYVLPNYNDVTLFDYPNNQSSDDMFVIGYQGSTTHDSDLRLILPVIDQIMSRHKNVYMQIVGSVRKDSIKKLFAGIKNKDRFAVTGGTPAFDTFPTMIMDMPWDIGVAPLIDDQFNRGKSHIKYLEYSMKKIPTIASHVYPYTHNAKEAILCNTQADWNRAIKDMLLKPNKRKQIGAKAYEHVVNECQYKDHAQDWIDAAQAVINNYKK